MHWYVFTTHISYDKLASRQMCVILDYTPLTHELFSVLFLLNFIVTAFSNLFYRY